MVRNKGSPAGIEPLRGTLPDAVTAFRRMMDNNPLISHEETIDLIRLVQQGNAEAQDRLVMGHLRLVHRIANRYQGCGLPLADLLSEGTLGLMRAIRKFDPEHGCRFSTYATCWIRQAISRAIAHQKPIRYPVHIHDQLIKLGRCASRLRRTLDREPTLEELARAMSMTEEALLKLLTMVDCCSELVELDAPVGGGGSDGQFDQLIDLIATASSGDQPEPAILAYDLKKTIDHLLQSLDEREQAVIKLRYGLNNQRPHTSREVGGQLKLSPERIRLIERAALKKLRHKTLAQELLRQLSQPQRYQSPIKLFGL